MCSILKLHTEKALRCCYPIDRNYMSGYACGNDKPHKEVVSPDLQECRADLRQLRVELLNVKNEPHAVATSLEKTYFKQYVRTLLQHYSRSVSAFLIH